MFGCGCPFFIPNLKVGLDGIVSGMVNDLTIEKKEFSLFSRDLNSFVNFIIANWNKIIKSGFVFQLNPLHSQFKPIVLHIKATSTGKANEEIISLLYQIRSILRNYRIEVISFSFDGDNAFKKLNENFFNSYFKRMINLNKLLNERMVTIRISPDFLHIIKRIRYRLLSNRIHMNFFKNSPFIDIFEIEKLLKDVPKIVFNNLQITKMHDILPLTLFSLHNFIILFEKKKYIEAAYWFPVSLAICAMNSKNIGFYNRRFFLECSLWFLIYYKKKYDDCQNKTLKERKYGESIDVVPYTNELLIEFSNCLFSDINIIDNYQNVNVGRNSTRSLEHTFGRARVKVNNIHTLKKFIDTVAQMNDQIYKKTEEDIDQIKGRSSFFGVTFEDYEEPKEILTFEPQTVAIQFLNLINIDNSADLEDENYDELFEFVEYLKDFDQFKKKN